MTKFLSLILTLGLAVCVLSNPEQKKSYKGYKVIRITRSAEKDSSVHSVGELGIEKLKAFQEIASAVNKVAEAHLLDIWGANAVQGWVDVMIPPHLVESISELFSNMHYTTHVADVQDSIDESERDRAQSRTMADFFSDFQTYDIITGWLQQSAANHSTIAKTYSIGKTNQGRDIYAIDLAPGNNKPVVVIQCGIHAREWITPTTCCWSIDQILNKDAQGAKLLDTFNIIFIPVLNVDGYVYTHTSDRMWRKNRQANSGSSCVGTDLNRNYDYEWSKSGASPNACSETYYGAAPFSGTEANVVKNLLDKHNGNLISYWDIHAYSGLWMSPWGYTCNEYPADYKTMEANMAASAAAAYAVNGNRYDYGAICPIIYQTSGGSIDYSYGVDKVVESYSVEAYGSSFAPPASWIPRIGSEIYAGVRTSIGLYKPTNNIVNQQ